MLSATQEYLPPWEVRSGLKVRLPLDTIVLESFTTMAPVEFIHVAFIPHESVYTSPATGFPTTMTNKMYIAVFVG